MGAEQLLLKLAGKLWPALDTLEETERADLLSELIGIIYGAILTAIGLGWLIGATDLALARAQWPTLLLMLLLAIILNQLDFFWIVKRRVGTYDRWNSPLGGLAAFSAALLFGPTAIWLGVVVLLSYSAQRWRKTPLATLRWNVLRNLALNLSSFALGSLLGLALYQQLGQGSAGPWRRWPR
jgi:hypothetical protein